MPHRTAVLLTLVALAACGHAPPAPAPAPLAAPTPAEAPLSKELEYLRSRALIVPVAGVPVEKVPDTFNAARDGARKHNAVDILAPRGTPVLSADDGRVLSMRSNSLGGITIYAVDPDARLVYYYAHLDHYREHLAEGMRLARGDTIGFVGTTGNAPKDTPHLHFQVMIMSPDGKYWTGLPLDPRPYFVATPPPASRPRATGKAGKG